MEDYAKSEKIGCQLVTLSVQWKKGKTSVAYLITFDNHYNHVVYQITDNIPHNVQKRKQKENILFLDIVAL